MMNALDHLVRLVQLRKHEGLTQNQIAARLGTSQANVVRLERAGKSITVAQLEDWLHACGASALPNAGYVAQLDKLSPDPLHGFLIGADSLLRSFGSRPGWHQKPCLAMIPNGFDDHRVTVGLLRDFLFTAATGFWGLLMPSPQMSVLFKHVSDRPAGLCDIVCRLTSPLPKRAFGAPLDWSQNAPTQDQDLPSGSLLALEDERRGSAAVVFLDHPLLRMVDVFRPGFDLGHEQAMHDLEATIAAEIKILCSGPRAIPSILTMIISRLARQEIACVACPSTVNPGQLFAEINHDQPRPTKLSLNESNSLDYSNTAALQALLTGIQEADRDTMSRIRCRLDERSMHLDPEEIRPTIRSPSPPRPGLGEVIDDELGSAVERQDLRAVLKVAHGIMRAFSNASKGGLVIDLPRVKYENVLGRWKNQYTDSSPDPEIKAVKQDCDTAIFDAIYNAWDTSNLSGN